MKEVTSLKKRIESTTATATAPLAAPIKTPVGLPTQSAIVRAEAPSIVSDTPRTFRHKAPLLADAPKGHASAVYKEEVDGDAFPSKEIETLVEEAASSTGAKPSSIRALIKEIAFLGRIFAQFSASYRDLYTHSLEKYASLAQNQISGMNAMAATTIVSSVVGGAAGVGASFVPGLMPRTIPAVPFLTPDLVQAVLKNSGEILPRVGDGAKTILQGPVVQAESERAMVDRAEITVQQQMIDQLAATLREVRQIVESIQQAKARQEG